MRARLGSRGKANVLSWIKGLKEKTPLGTAILVAITALFVGGVFATQTLVALETRSVTSNADTRILQDTPTHNYGATTLGASGDSPAGSWKDEAALIRWDLSEIEPGTKVSSATVTLTVANTSPQSYEAYELKREWTESEATWDLYASDKSWEGAGAGGSLDRDPTTVGAITPSLTGKQTFSLSASVVQGWVDDPSTNHGIIISNQENTDDFGFYSRESSDSNQHPQLTVGLGAPDYTPPRTTIASGPSGTVESDSASFAFSSSETGSSLACSLDGAAFSPCTSPTQYSGLVNGPHTFEVKATDVAGNSDPTPARRTWTVETTPPKSDPVLVGAGDIASGGNDNDEATAALIRDIPGTVFTLGDNVYNSGSLAEFNSYYEPTWGTEKARTKPTPGNHEYDFGTTKQYGAGYFDYFGAVAAEDNDGSYSYELGDWHIISLNTGQCVGDWEADNSTPGCGPGDPMLTWLESDLQANEKQCTLAYFHHPLFSSGREYEGGDTGRATAIWNLLYAYDADVVVSGHEHVYERFAPQNPDGVADSGRGIRQFVVGTGGRSLFEFATIMANSEVRNNDTYGVIKFTLHPGSYDWEFVPVADQIFTDSGSQDCH